MTRLTTIRSEHRGRIASALATAALAALVTAIHAQPQRPPGQPAPAQPPAQGQPASPGDQPPQPPPTFRTGINYVSVDVIVTDKQGNPVTDLKAEDFDVTEDNKPQTVETFRLLKLNGQPAPGAEAPRQIRSDYDEESEALREDVRIFVIFLDDYHVRRGGSMGVRDPLIKFIQNQLGPLDMVGLMYPLMPVTDLRLTRNHEAIMAAIRKFDGRKFDYRPRNEFEDKYSMYPAETVERIRNEVSLSALKGLVTHLGGVREARKAVILVSEGYSNYLPPQLRDPVAEMPGMGNANRRRPGLGDGSVNEERAQFFQNLDIQSEMREVYNAANRANTAIYALDPRGLAVFEYDIDEGVGTRIDSQVLGQTQDTLRVLADETDGRAIVNRNDLEGGLKQVVRDSSAYYLIGYNSTQAPQDGKFHEIKVRLKRPGLQVRARKGYWALTAAETAVATAPKGPGPDPKLTKALASVESGSRSRLIRTWVGTSYADADSGKTKVTFLWEPVPPVPGETRRGTPARVSLIAAGDEGAAFRGKVEPDTSAPTSAPGSAPGHVTFDAAPGRLQLRLSIEGTTGEVLDSDMLDIVVPDYTEPKLAISTVEVLRARTAREFQTISNDPGATPVAGREFRRTERLLIRFGATGPGDTKPTIAVRLLNRAGQRMVDLTVQPLASDPTRYQVDLPLSGLPAGDFLVEVAASVEGADTKELVGFRVTAG